MQILFSNFSFRLSIRKKNVLLIRQIKKNRKAKKTGKKDWLKKSRLGKKKTLRQETRVDTEGIESEWNNENVKTCGNGNSNNPLISESWLVRRMLCAIYFRFITDYFLKKIYKIRTYYTYFPPCREISRFCSFYLA